MKLFDVIVLYVVYLMTLVVLMYIRVAFSLVNSNSRYVIFLRFLILSIQLLWLVIVLGSLEGMELHRVKWYVS